MNKTVTYTVSPEIHRTLVDFFSRLDLDTATEVLGIPWHGEAFSEPEREIKAQLLFQFYFNELLNVELEMK